eukprot:evm.model.scf_561EXC.4 EVM.evm.TU.scf_561EXC.4   scf_561EXC:32271-33401(-)
MPPLWPLALALLATAARAGPPSAPTTGCRDPSGAIVDWWAALKRPGGFRYGYLDATAGPPGLDFSSPDDLDMPLTPWWRTLDPATAAVLSGRHPIPAQMAPGPLGAIFYNDEMPDGREEESRAHAKGAIVFDSRGGAWVTHSIPRFPQPPTANGSIAELPASAWTEAQHAFCITLAPGGIEALAGALALMRPNVYPFSAIPDALRLAYPNATTLLRPSPPPPPPSLAAIPLASAQGTQFILLAKSPNFVAKIHDFVEQYFNAPMEWQTWRRGRGGRLPSCCPPACPIETLNVAGVAAANRSAIAWPYTRDHSKWGVALGRAGMEVFCAGDLNRMASQERRGGGFLCGVAPRLWRAFRGVVGAVEACASADALVVHH